MLALWIVLGIIAVIGIFLWVTYNGLVTLKIRVDEAWSDITVQLKRRMDLIPNLVNSVKGYAAHESGVFQAVTEARSNVLNAQGVKETAEAENMLEGALKSLFAVSEAYPDLIRKFKYFQIIFLPACLALKSASSLKSKTWLLHKNQLTCSFN